VKSEREAWLGWPLTKDFKLPQKSNTCTLDFSPKLKIKLKNNKMWERKKTKLNSNLSFCVQGMLKGCFLVLQNEAIYKRACFISATRLNEEEEAAITGSPRSDRGLGWNRISALFLLHGHSNSWVFVEEVKIHLFMIKCWVKRLQILQITSNNYT